MSAATGFGALYPFLSDAPAQDADVLADLHRSTAEKIAESAALRAQCLDRYADALAACAGDLAARLAAGGRLLTFGNGGSSTDAAAVATLFLHPGEGEPALPAVALAAEVATLTALGNDVGFDVVFSRQIATFGRPADVALGLSTSGNSPNAVRAFDEAHGRGLLTVAFAGHDGGQFATLATVDHLFVVPSASVHRIQEAQTTLYHVLWRLTCDAFEEVASRR